MFAISLKLSHSWIQTCFTEPEVVARIFTVHWAFIWVFIMGNYPYPICIIFSCNMHQVLYCVLIWPRRSHVKKKRLKERGQNPAIRDQTSLTINDSLYAQKDHFFLRDQRDQSEHRIRFIMLLPDSAIYLLNWTQTKGWIIKQSSSVPFPDAVGAPWAAHRNASFQCTLDLVRTTNSLSFTLLENPWELVICECSSCEAASSELWGPQWELV